jgi:orotidine-5'-phosphate decarboxylase
MSGTASHRIEARERLIVALDVPAPDAARALAERIGDAACFYKVGLELLTSGGSFELVQWLAGRGNRVFADFKFFDIPETVRRAVANLRGRGVTFATVHGSRPIMEAAASAKGKVRILAVTVLTSMGPAELKEMGYGGTVEELVISRARNALDSGCDGVIASGLEAPMLKAEFGDRLLVVTPGIRPAGQASSDDQKRTVDAAQAFRNGADYIVVGRPVRDAADPRAAAQSIQKTIATAFPA